MDILTRKFILIEYLIGLQDEKVLSKIESTIFDKKKQQKIKLKVFTKEELVSRDTRSSANYNFGKFKTQEQLVKEITNW